MKKNIVSYLAENSRVHSHKPAFIVLEDGADIERRVSYEQLHRKVIVLYASLARKKWEGQQAILLYTDVIDFIVSFLACQYAGITPIPVFFSNAAKQKSRLDGILKDSGARIALSTLQEAVSTGKLHQEISSDNTVEWFYTDEEEIDFNVDVPEVTDDSRPAFIQYTSGSTGHPKGIVITAANLLANEQAIKETFGCNEQSVIFSWLPFFHDMGLIGNLLHTIYVGCTCVVMSPMQFVQDPKKWLKGISKYKVTHSGGPNFAYDLCVSRIAPEQVSNLDLSSWKIAYNGSEPVRADTLHQFSERFKSIGFNKNAFVPCYGLAEATLLVAGVKDEDAAASVITVDADSISGDIIQLTNATARNARKMASAGRLAAGIKVKIHTEHAPVKDLQQGEICIAGDSITQGYWNKNSNGLFVEIEGEKFLRTGDTGFFYNGELFISGRIKEMIVVRGKNIYPYDIEQAVYSAVEGVSMNGVAVFSRAEKEEELVVFAELTKSALAGKRYIEIIEQINNEVTAVSGVSPYDVVLVNPLAIPRTTSGKLQRVKCREQYERKIHAAIASKLDLPAYINRRRDPLLVHEVLTTKSSDAVERYLFDLIRSKIPHFNQSYIDHSAELTGIGLDSIKAMELTNTISRELDINLDLYRIFRGNTFGNLVGLIESTLWIKNNQLSGKEIII